MRLARPVLSPLKYSLTDASAIGLIQRLRALAPCFRELYALGLINLVGKAEDAGYMVSLKLKLQCKLVSDPHRRHRLYTAYSGQTAI